jgi:uncharacterized protein YndB with AHSA1/START domain
VTRIAGEVTIAAPVEEVFDLVADERNEPRYNPRIEAVRKLGAGPVGAGARFVAEPRNMGRRGEMTLTIQEYDRPWRLHNVITSSYMKVDGTLTFEEVEGGTRLSWDWDMGLVGPMRLLSPLLAAIGPSWERRNWVGLKDYVEAHRTGSV